MRPAQRHSDRLEPTTAALVERVSMIELDGSPVRKRNNLIWSFRSLSVIVTPNDVG